MISRFFTALWGDISREDYKKIGLLSGVFFFLIGAYWMTRVMKNAIFMKVVGSTGIPYAKMISVLVLILLATFYAKLVDWFCKSNIVYILSATYGIIFLLITYFLSHPTIGLPNTVASKGRIYGWIAYMVIESYGSLMPSLFWSFVAGTMDTELAKKGYGIIFFVGQFGTVLGCALDMQATAIGLQPLLLIASIGVLLILPMVKLFMTKYPVAVVPGGTQAKQATGFLEGLRLLFTRPYLLGILGVTTLYEVISAIVDYQMQRMVDAAYPTASGAAEFLGLYGLIVNVFAMMFALLGTSFFLRKLGLRFSLIAFPAAVAVAICFMWSFHCLWVILITMVVIKFLSYTLNNPCKEIMYIPTSRDVRFKAKSWVDTVGMRSAKGVGGGVCALFPVMANLVYFGSIISLGIVGIWVGAAFYVGKKNHELVQENKIIE